MNFKLFFLLEAFLVVFFSIYCMCFLMFFRSYREAYGNRVAIPRECCTYHLPVQMGREREDRRRLAGSPTLIQNLEVNVFILFPERKKFLIFPFPDSKMSARVLNAPILQTCSTLLYFNIVFKVVIEGIIGL